MKIISLVSLVYIVKMKRFAIWKGLLMHFFKIPNQAMLTEWVIFKALIQM